MATIKEKFDMISDKNVKIMFAYLMDYSQKLSDNNGICFLSPTYDISSENVGIALEHDLDEELIQELLEGLVMYGLANEIYSPEMGGRVITMKPSAVKVARDFLQKEGYPEYPERTYHIYQLDKENEQNMLTPVVVVVRDNPFDVIGITKISKKTGEEFGLTSDIISEMQDNVPNLRNNIRKIENEKPLAFHLSPLEWYQANQANPPLVSLIENASYGIQMQARSNGFDRDMTNVQKNTINVAYNADALDAMNAIESLIKETRENGREINKGYENETHSI